MARRAPLAAAPGVTPGREKFLRSRSRAMKPPTPRGSASRGSASRALASSVVVSALAQWADHLEGVLDPRRVGNALLPVLIQSAGATRGSLMLVDPGAGRLRVVAGIGLPSG